MARFILLESGVYCNVNFILSVGPVFDSPDWKIQVDYETGAYIAASGVFASEADAVSAIQKVFETVDPSTF